MFKIERLEDGKTFYTKEYKFITFNEDGRGNSFTENPKIGASLIIPPYNKYYTWLTSVITVIIDDYNFKTNNSTYKISEYEHQD